MKMSPLKDGIEIAAGGHIQLQPGGLHIMFMQLKQPLAPSNMHQVTLTFDNCGDMPVMFKVTKTPGKAIVRIIPPAINTSVKRARNYWPGQTGKNLKKFSLSQLFIVALVGAYSLSEYIARQLYPQNTGAPMQLGSPFT